MRKKVLPELCKNVTAFWHYPQKIYIHTWIHLFNIKNHRENGGTLGMVPLIINPIYTLYSEYFFMYLLGIPPLKGSNRGVEQLGYHAKGFPSIFPMKEQPGHFRASQLDVFGRRFLCFEISSG